MPEQSDKPVILSKEMLVPAGAAIALAIGVISVGMFISGIQSDTKQVKEQFIAHVAENKTVEVRITTLERSQAVSDTKLDSILESLNEIRKKLNIQ